MTLDHVIDLAMDLEKYLGDPHDPAGPMPYERVLKLDEDEAYPHEFVGLLQRWGLHLYGLPSEHGGRAADVETGYHLFRMVARRDPTTAVALSLSLLTVMPVWIAGTLEQLGSLVADVGNGATIAWGLSERGHGSDVLSNETRAEKVDGGYLITGEKDLIGNATVADVVVVQARTGERGGPGDWSLFALRKRACPAGSVIELPKDALHGLRGFDLSGIRLDRVFVPDSALIGYAGKGLEIVLKSSQVARTVVPGLALGAADTAMRVTCDFASSRRIFGRQVVDIPNSRRQLAESLADLLLAEAVCIGAVRGLQANPEQCSTSSSVVKFFVPTLLEQTVSRLSVVLGARQYLRSHSHYGIFQKMCRDLLVTNFADGNTQVNLKNIVAGIDVLLGEAGHGPADPEARSRVGTTFNVDAPLPALEPQRLTLFNRRADDTLVELAWSIGRLRVLAGGQVDRRQREWFEAAAALADRLRDEMARVIQEVAAVRRRPGFEQESSAEIYFLAEQYCALHAAAAAVHLVVNSFPVLSDPFPDGAVLLMMLHRIWQRFHPTDVLGSDVYDRTMEVLLTLHEERRLFSHLPIPVQASSGAGT